MFSTKRALEIAEDADRPVGYGGRIIAHIRGTKPGPTLIITGSIHGNEPAGTLAAHKVADALNAKQDILAGEIILLTGNLKAFRQRVRYIDTDLNRHWTEENIQARTTQASTCSETKELSEILEILKETVSQSRGDVYFVDLHTTSAPGVPFATVGDTLRNRRFAMNFPVTIVLGLEEQIDGTLLEFLNNRGVITMGLEAGQHEASTSVDNHEAVIWVASVATGNLTSDQVKDFDLYQHLLERAGGGTRIVEVRHRHVIRASDDFQMEPGFSNFQPISKGQVLAHDRTGAITASESGLILLPLYQKLGDDGFFLGREVKFFWLKLSAVLRHLKIGNYAYVLPGVRRTANDKDTFIVNTRIARLLPLQIFHLLGFRKRRWQKGELVVSKRKYDLEGPKTFGLD